MQRWLARAIYYPTLGYNLLLGRVLKIRPWWDAVGEHVVLGARPMPRDPVLLKQIGITGVVNMCEEMRGPTDKYQQLDIDQLWLPTTDFNHPSAVNVERGADFIQEHVDRGGKVYVHCKAGRASSATVVLWWLIKHQHMTPEAAQEKILACRPHANRYVFQRPVIRELYSELAKQTSPDEATAEKSPSS